MGLHEKPEAEASAVIVEADPEAQVLLQEGTDDAVGQGMLPPRLRLQRV
jgi:hypothetical protein